MSNRVRDHNEEFMRLLATQEDLDDELQQCADDTGPFGMSIRHPLVYSICHSPQMNAFVNAQLKQKQEAVDRAEREEDWTSYIYLHERPYRLDAFNEICWKLEPQVYWELLGDVWVDSENIYQNRDEWRDLLEFSDGCHMEDRMYMSSEEDRKVFTLPPEKGGLLPETVIHRGYRHEDGLDGFSWTLDKPRAKWFAKRFPHQEGVATVATGKVKREHVLAYHTGRGELEIVVLPEHVFDVSVEEFEGDDAE